MDEINPELPALIDLSFKAPVRGLTMSSDEAMTLALFEASRGYAHVSPNPLVGCVVLDSQKKFLSSGAHLKVGEAHAEVNALCGLSGTDLQGAHVFVTLEPCAHEGRTPSCARMLAELPLGEVQFGIVDPNPLVAGQGQKILQAAGIRAALFQSSQPRLHQAIEEIAEIFLFNFRKQKIFTSLKVASSLDGQIALANGESQWITGPESRRVSHQLRAAHDATLIGVGTLFADNPSLNIRRPGLQKKNIVIVLDSQGQGLRQALANPKKFKIFDAHEPQNLIWVVNKKPTVARTLLDHVQIIEMGSTRDILEVYEKLWNLGLRSVFVEGGAQVLSHFLKNQLGQRLFLFQAPVLIGAKNGRSFSEGFGIESLRERLELKNVRRLSLGPDLLTTGILHF